MTIDIIFSFAVVSIALCFSPGPIVFIIIGQSIYFRDQPLLLGIVSGDFLKIILSFLGVGTFLSIYPFALVGIKVIGSIYLFYLGISIFNDKSDSFYEKGNIKPLSVYRDIFIVSILNPKGILFFVVFFPLFITKEESFIYQSIILTIIFLFISVFSVYFYLYFTKEMNSDKFNKISGILLVIIALFIMLTILIK